ncbi:flagellar filament capping protein FliD [Geotalea uraniireducens]|uniref:Flagellar hook-associated protein 2 n=1 Tax=Geotalea uraniireducens (strain Rf4) TaxID=351605 RepID=A5G8W9_GEOUR|nr:flagellar filament capping protein FliD [Geotalea uraniireducens]ABQ28237.1 flagellar hook-associated 2 domain protein [Geotalea uraniireducens Rf4]
MSSISFGGLATGLDTAKIITQLMSLERIPQQLLQAQQQKNSSKISRYQSIGDALTSLQSIVKGLNTVTNFSVLQSTVADSSVTTATATSSATPGTHTVQVVSLAKSQRQVSTGVASDTSLTFSTGNFTVSDGTTTTTVNITEGQNSLQGIASAINSSGANVSASIINDGTNYRLVVTGKDTKNYTLDFSGLATPPVGGTGALTPTLLGVGDPTYQAGTDTQLVVDGVTMTKTSNTVTDAIQGVTLKLLKEGATTTVTVANDTEAVTKKINDFVAGYNRAITLVNAESAYNTDTKSAGVLSGDSTLRTIQGQLRSLLTATVSGATGSITSLAALGINSDSKTGLLSVDATKLSKALDDNYTDVVDYFTHNGSSMATLPANQYGIAQQFNLVLDTMVHPYIADGVTGNGSLEVRKKGLAKTNADIDKQISRMEDRVLQMQSNLQRQFSAMELMVSNLQSQGTMLINSLNASLNNN